MFLNRFAHLGAAAVLIWLVDAVSAGKAVAGPMVLCNEKDEAAHFAMVWNEGDPILFPRWIGSGWVQIRPKQCIEILTSRLRQYVYVSLSVKNPSTGKSRLSLYPLKDPGQLQFADTGLYGVEVFFCVKDEPFKRTTVQLAEQQQCPTGYYEQLFTVLGVSRSDRSLTMNLN